MKHPLVNPARGKGESFKAYKKRRKDVAHHLKYRLDIEGWSYFYKHPDVQMDPRTGAPLPIQPPKIPFRYADYPAEGEVK